MKRTTGKRKKKPTATQWKIIAVILGVPTFIVALITLIQFIPFSNLDVLMYESTTDLIYSNDNTTVIGFNVTFSAQITNTGNIPLHIIAFDIFPKNSIPSDKSYPYVSIRYLQPNESFDHNFTKLFNVLIPVKTGTIEQYVGAVIYRDNSGNVKWVLKDLWNPLG